ncbi:MAG: transcription initiation factor IIB family protein [Nitrosopumilus sp.]|nr:transcription initiation factor IIB family protein [Nitrosopumilus sp.]
MKHLSTIIQDNTTGEQICACCGMVIFEKTVDEKAPQTFLDEPNKIHHHMSTNAAHHDYGLGTIVDPYQKESSEINIWQQRLRVANKKDSKTCRNFEALEIILGQHTIPKHMQNITYYLSRKATKNEIDSGRRIVPFQLSLLYFAYDISGNKISRKEFEKRFPLSKEKIFWKYARLIREKFNIITDHKSSIEKSIYKTGIDLKFSKKTIILANSIFQHANKKNMTSGRSPSGIVGAALYIAAYSTIHNPKPLQEIIAYSCNISQKTIDNVKSSWKDIINLLCLRHVVAVQTTKNLRISDL